MIRENAQRSLQLIDILYERNNNQENFEFLKISDVESIVF